MPELNLVSKALRVSLPLDGVLIHRMLSPQLPWYSITHGWREASRVSVWLKETEEQIIVTRLIEHGTTGTGVWHSYDYTAALPLEKLKYLCYSDCSDILTI